MTVVKEYKCFKCGELIRIIANFPEGVKVEIYRQGEKEEK